MAAEDQYHKEMRERLEVVEKRSIENEKKLAKKPKPKPKPKPK